MEHNDLANTPSPCVYVVWEGLIAVCSNPKKYSRYLWTRRYAKALDCYETQTLAVDAMWQAMMRGPYGLAVVTYLPEPLGARLSDRLDLEVVPCRDVVATTPRDFVRRLAHMPWVVAVADPSPVRTLAYGSYGRHIPAEHPELLGGLL